MSSEAVEWRSACRWLGTVTFLYALVNTLPSVTNIALSSSVQPFFGGIYALYAFGVLFVLMTPITLWTAGAQQRRGGALGVLIGFGSLQALIGLMLGIWGFAAYGPLGGVMILQSFLVSLSYPSLVGVSLHSYSSAMVGPVFLYMFVVGFQLSLLAPIAMLVRALGDRDIDDAVVTVPSKSYAAAVVNLFVGFVGLIHTILFGIMYGQMASYSESLSYLWLPILAVFAALYSFLWMIPGTLAAAAAKSKRAGMMSGAATAGMVLFTLKLMTAIFVIAYTLGTASQYDPYFFNGLVEALPYMVAPLFAVCFSFASMIVAIVVAFKAGKRMRAGGDWRGGYVVHVNQDTDGAVPSYVDDATVQKPVYDTTSVESKA